MIRQCEREQMLFLECARTALPLSLMRDLRKRYLPTELLTHQLRIWPDGAFLDDQMRYAFIMGCVRQHTANCGDNELEYIVRNRIQ